MKRHASSVAKWALSEALPPLPQTRTLRPASNVSRSKLAAIVTDASKSNKVRIAAMESLRLVWIDIRRRVCSRNQTISSWKTELNILRSDSCVSWHYCLPLFFWLVANRLMTLTFPDESRKRRRSPLPCKPTNNIRTLCPRSRALPGVRSKATGRSISKTRMKSTESFTWSTEEERSSASAQFRETSTTNLGFGFWVWSFGFCVSTKGNEENLNRRQQSKQRFGWIIGGPKFVAELWFR